jgi:hypothetical protein
VRGHLVPARPQARLDQTVPVRAIDAPATPIRRPGVLDVSGELPAITPIVNLSEQDLTDEMILAMQLAGLNVDWQPAVDASAAIGALTVDNTLEVMRGQLLSTGIVALEADDGSIHEVDFEVPDSQKITVAAAWNAGGAGDEFDDIDAAHEVFSAAAGSPAGAILTTRKVARHLLHAVQTMYPQQPVGTTRAERVPGGPRPAADLRVRPHPGGRGRLVGRGCTRRAR